jgi:hypothetical protein
MDAEKLVGSKVTLFAVIGNWELDSGERYEVAAYSSAFELNNIPAGTVAIPVGYALDDGTPSKIMSTFNKFVAKQKIAIYLKIETDTKTYGDGLGAFQGADPVRIFRGYVTGAILRRTATSLHIVVHFSHWLSDLNNSSILSGSSHVSNPFALYDEGAEIFLAGNGTNSGGGGGTDACQFDSAEAAWSILNVGADNLTGGGEDLWEVAIKPFLRCIVLADSMAPDLAVCFNTDEAKQKRLAALDAIKTGGLVFKQDTGLIELTSEAVEHLRRGISNTDANSSIWGTIIGNWCSDFFFAICPCVEDAIVAPLVGSYKSETGYKTIEPGDYYAIDLNLSSRQSIGAVFMISNNSGQTGALETLNPTDWPGFWPKKQDCDVDKYNGVILARNMPYWLVNLLFEPETPDTSEIPITPFDAISAGAAVLAAKIEKDKKLRKSQLNNLADAFARFFYVNEIFNNRSCDISGKLRFDICPGTTVKVQAAALDKDANLPFDVFYGQVVRVSYTIDATQGAVSTVLTLSNLRTQTELDDDVFSMSQPPLYQNAWDSAPLLPEYFPVVSGGIF